MVSELAAEQVMTASMGLSAETLTQGKAGSWHRAARGCTLAGAALTLLARRSRLAGGAGGAALVAGSLATRFAIFEAGQQSARDPKYTVVPQRDRLRAGQTG